MTPQPPIRVIAGIVAMTAFCVACVAGIAGGVEAATILTRAMTCMALAYPVGALTGWVSGFAVREHARRYEVAHPVPTEEPVAPKSRPTDAQNPRSPHNPTAEEQAEEKPRAAA